MAKASVLVEWDDVPHLTAEQKESVLSGIPQWQREARTKGVPSLGAGAIYPVAEGDIIIDPFVIPEHWKRGYGLDPGWNRTAAIFMAWDPEGSGCVAYADYYKGLADPAVHVAALRAMGADWMTGVVDPAAMKVRGLKGEILFDVYKQMGLTLKLANNSVEPGLLQVWNMLSTNQLKIIRTLTDTRNEMRLYRRNEKGEIVKENDHLMDALRYVVMSGKQWAKLKPTGNVDGRPWYAWSPTDIWSG
jgi:hypothetical protein